jgi:quinol-cytochrome oxidoreductase complex cytochrome b subunit/coenzyme F420-reducing hydrogenase delta subunit/ferredoxin
MPGAATVAPASPPAPGELRRVFLHTFDAIEIAFDRAFPAAANPWRHLGGLAFLLFWIVAATGIYLYIGFDARAAGAYASVERLGSGALPLGALARSLHRYASDAFVAVTLLHLAREWVRGRYAHVRCFSWITGVAALWLLFASGIGGFWLVWDGLAHYSLAATLEWLDALPMFAGALVRNVVATEAASDRLFSLLIFLHIGLPLALLATMWLHVARLAKPATCAPRTLAVGTLAALLAVALALPVASAAPADASSIPPALSLDWFYLGLHVLQDRTSPGALWLIVLGATVLLLALPPMAQTARPSAARIDLAHCNGCARCADDCPYAAVTMEPRTDGRPLSRQAVLDADLCTACGICAGACPSSVSLRSAKTGIDLPEAPLRRVCAALDAGLAQLRSAEAKGTRIVVFGCPSHAGGPDLAQLHDVHTATVPLTCAGQLPPSLVERALDAGADGVFVTGCREGDCAYRFGNDWTAARLAGKRAPRLRAGLWPARVRIAWVGRGDDRALRRALVDFRDDLRPERPR